MKKRLNVNLLAILLGALAVSLVAVVLLHSWQMRRHAATLIARAHRAEAANDLERAAVCLQRYLVFAPEDNDTRAHYGELIEQLATSDHERWRAVSVYERVLYREPSRHDVRRRLAQLALRLGWTSEARLHLETLLQEQTRQADLEYLLGRCQEEAQDYALAAASYQRAVESRPNLVEAHVRLAHLYQYRLGEPEKAGRVLDAMVQDNRTSAAAYLARGSYHWSRGALAESQRDVERARQLAPEDVDVLRASADLERRWGRFGESRRYLQHGLQRDPRNLALHLALVDLALEEKHEDEAIEFLRQGLRALPDQPDLLLLLGETLLGHGDEAEAAEVIRQLRRPGSPPGLAHYLVGRLQMKRGEWSRAGRTLEEVVDSPQRAPALASRACVALARCRAQQGDSESQRAALFQAVQFDGSSALARMALAAALQDAGRMEEALEQYHTLVQSPQPPDQAWILFGRLLLQRNRSRPPRKRAWNEIERLLERASRLPRLEVPLIVLRAEVLLERGQDDQARTLLEQAVISRPEEVPLWTALAELTRRQGKPTQSAGILKRARRKAGDRPELFQAEIALCVAWPPRKARETLRRLEKDLSRLSPDDQTPLLRRMAMAWFEIGEYEDGRRLCRVLAERSGKDFPSRLALLDLALRAGEEKLLAELVADLRRLEGDEGTWWRYGEAARLILRVQRGDSNRLDEVRALAADIKHRRPEWPRGALLEAYVCELEGTPAAAADAYLRAFRGGEQPPGMAERLVRLLTEHGRLDEADDVIRKVQRQTTPSAELARLGAEIALRQRANERAVELSRLAVAADTDDYSSLLWLGPLLASAGRPGEAEETLRRAVRLRDDLAETWLALIAHLLRAEQPQEAENIADEMNRRLPANQLLLARARAAELLGQLHRADQEYQLAVARAPGDAIVLQQAARFHLRLNQFSRAETLLQRLLTPESDAPEANQAWARRRLALLLAFDSAGQYRQALALLDEKPVPKQEALADCRARLLVHGTRPEDLSASLRQLEQTAKLQPFAPEELFYLSRLYEAANDLKAVEERMLDLLALDRNNPEYLAFHISHLLRRGHKDDARTWIARLETLEPDSSRVQSFRIQLRTTDQKK